MLILGRRIGERIKIGDEVTVTVLDVEQHHYGCYVRLGISAPRDIPVHREEIYLKNQEKKENGTFYERSGNC